MAEPMRARGPARHPAPRRPRIPHPHLAPRPAETAEDLLVPAPPPPAAADPLHDSEGWTPAAVPLVRPDSRWRRDAERPSTAERTLRAALHVGLVVNLGVLVASRWLPGTTLGGWKYDGDDILLAAAVLLSGYALLAVGRLSRRGDKDV